MRYVAAYALAVLGGKAEPSKKVSFHHPSSNWLWDWEGMVQTKTMDSHDVNLGFELGRIANVLVPHHRILYVMMECGQSGTGD